MFFPFVFALCFSFSIYNDHKIKQTETHSFLADRAFLSCTKGPEYYSLHCPQSLKKNQKQFTTKQANASRKVTLFRHTVERSFGRRKAMWGILDSKIPHQLLASGQFTKVYRILAAIDNAFCQRLYQDKEDHSIQIVKIQNAHLKNVTKLAMMVENRKKWQSTNYDELKQKKLIPDFKTSDLTPAVCGIYAYGLSKSYLNNAEELKFELHPDLPSAIRISGLVCMI